MRALTENELILISGADRGDAAVAVGLAGAATGARLGLPLGAPGVVLGAVAGGMLGASIGAWTYQTFQGS